MPKTIYGTFVTDDSISDAATGRTAIHVELKTNSSKQLRISTDGATNTQYFTRGFYMPDEIYTR